MRREGRADDGGGCATVRQSTAHVYLMFSSSLTGMAGAHAPRRESAELRSRSFTSFNFLVCKDSFDIDASCSLEISTFHKRILEWHRQVHRMVSSLWFCHATAGTRTAHSVVTVLFQMQRTPRYYTRVSRGPKTSHSILLTESQRITSPQC
jgi:hypothetical protein